METQKFTHQGKEYEIRVVCDGETVFVKAFLKKKAANRFRYTATIDKIQDFRTVKGMDAVRHLIETAKQDVINGIK